MQQWEYMTLRLPVQGGQGSAKIDIQDLADRLNARCLDG